MFIGFKEMTQNLVAQFFFSMDSPDLIFDTYFKKINYYSIIGPCRVKL